MKTKNQHIIQFTALNSLSDTMVEGALIETFSDDGTVHADNNRTMIDSAHSKSDFHCPSKKTR